MTWIGAVTGIGAGGGPTVDAGSVKGPTVDAGSSCSARESSRRFRRPIMVSHTRLRERSEFTHSYAIQ